MNLLWGDVPVCDAHLHFFSHNFLTLLSRQKGLTGGAEEAARLLEWDLPPSDPAELARLWARELSKNNVDRAALIASLPDDFESVAVAVQTCPDRFYGFFMIDPAAPDALQKAEQAFNRGLQGLCLFPALHRYSIREERVRALIELAASQPHRIVFVHCGLLSIGFRRKLGMNYTFDPTFSNPLDLQWVASRFPKLPFVVPHFGAGFLRETLMLLDLCPNVYLDSSSTNSWLRYQSGHLTLTDVFDRIIHISGPKKILFGTDSSYFPRGWQQDIYHEQTRILHDLRLNGDDVRLILGGNLDRLLRSEPQLAAAPKH